MKRKTITLLCAITFICSGAIPTYATTSDSQVTTEQSPREGRTVRDASNRPTSYEKRKSEKKSERKSPRKSDSKSRSNPKSK